MSDRNQYGGSHLFLAFLVGAAAGAAVAAMVSQEGGRERLRQWGRDVGDRASTLTGSAREALGRASEAAREAYARARKEPAQEASDRSEVAT